jgi:hypothetical protein
MGRSALETLRMMKDEEIDGLIRGLSGKRLVSDGSFLRKVSFAAAKVALVRPKTVLEIIQNLARG